jgi:hypothetical protein
VTALAAGTREAGGRRRLLPDSLTSVAWVTWRQHRTTLVWLGGLLLALGAGMLVAGIELRRIYAAEIQHGCFGSAAWSTVCRPLQTPFTVGWAQSYWPEIVPVMQAVPVIIGVFLGAPLLAREYTAGTVRFTWTQGIGRTRWAAATLGLLGAAVGAAGGLLGLLAQWSVQPITVQTVRETDRWEPGFFNNTALTAATAALLAFAIGVLAGALTRRVVAAMAVTAAGTITAADLAFSRLHYWLVGQGARVVRDLAFGADPNVGDLSGSTLTIHETAGPAAPGPAGAWLDQGWYAGANGQRLGDSAMNRLSNRLPANPALLIRLHDTFWVAYQPGYRYWVFQFIVSGGTLLAALLLGAAAIALIRYRRT